MPAVPIRRKPIRAYTRATSSLAAERKTMSLPRAIASPREQRADRSPVAAVAGGRQRGDADDLGRAEGGLERSARHDARRRVGEHGLGLVPGAQVAGGQPQGSPARPRRWRHRAAPVRGSPETYPGSRSRSGPPRSWPHSRRRTSASPGRAAGSPGTGSGSEAGSSTISGAKVTGMSRSHERQQRGRGVENPLDRLRHAEFPLTREYRLDVGGPRTRSHPAAAERSTASRRPRGRTAQTARPPPPGRPRPAGSRRSCARSERAAVTGGRVRRRR